MQCACTIYAELHSVYVNSVISTKKKLKKGMAASLTGSNAHGGSVTLSAGLSSACLSLLAAL